MSRYQDLVAKVDAKAAELSARHQEQLQCKQGCSSCCQAGLSVFSVEAKAIAEYLNQRPELKEQLLAAEATSSGSSCAFLDSKGLCQIYEVRPILCRTQGLPLRFQVNQRQRRDVCPLNFTEVSLASLMDSEILNLDLLNTLLVLIEEEEGKGGQHRWPLLPRSLLQSQDERPFP